MSEPGDGAAGSPFQVERVIVGLPLSLSGRDSAQTRETRGFAARLASAIAPVPVELYDERFTTSLAAQAPGSASLDSRAAAVLAAVPQRARQRQAQAG